MHLPASMAKFVAGLCRRMEPPYARAPGLWQLRGGACADLIHMLKYQQVAGPAANVLGRMLADGGRGSGGVFPGGEGLGDSRAPASEQASGNRGFNQAELVTRLALKLSSSRRSRYFLGSDGFGTKCGKTQVADWAERASSTGGRNLRRGFRVKHPEQVSGREILLVDDCVHHRHDRVGIALEFCGVRALPESGWRRLPVTLRNEVQARAARTGCGVPT